MNRWTNTEIRWTNTTELRWSNEIISIIIKILNTLIANTLPNYFIAEPRVTTVVADNKTHWCKI